MSTRQARPARPRWLILTGVIVLVVVAMGFGTKVVPKGEAKTALTGGQDPATFAAEKYPAISGQIADQAVDVVELAGAVKADQAAAATKFGQQEGTSAPVFSVKANGVAGQATADGILPIEVKGMPSGVKVYVQTGPALNGTAIRDATGTVHFQQFVNQLDYQTASDQLNNQVKAKVLKGIDTAALTGKQVSVTGAFQLVNPAAYILVPVQFEESR
ncbi:DUF2291 family protein [Streptomyces sp. NPDC000880]